VVAGAAAGAGPASTARSRAVILRNLAFHPASLAINRGESVTWLWRDGTEHNVTFHFVRSRTQKQGSYTLRFNRRGTFDYVCTIHRAEGMKGRIIVH
jgi:plastocyanin